ncbi:hypothetical protein [Streptomyces sp. NPDC002671]
MRCSTLRSTDMDDECTGTATHLMLYSMPKVPGEPGDREHHQDPVCEPCGKAYMRRPALKARIVPLRIYNPTPEFKDIAGGHRLVDHPYHEAACHDCMLLGSVEYFRQGRDKRLHGCRARPESVNSRELPQASIGPDTTLDELANLWWTYTTHQVGMGMGDWRPITDHPDFAATFTFRDREYGLRYSPNIVYVWAEKLENRGRPEPKTINPEYRENYKQVVFHFHDVVNKYGSRYFAAYTPGREDVILHAPEGAISAVLRFTELDGTRHRRLAVVTDAVCDTFGAIADLTFKDRLYGETE